MKQKQIKRWLLGLTIAAMLGTSACGSVVTEAAESTGETAKSTVEAAENAGDTAEYSVEDTRTDRTGAEDDATPATIAAVETLDLTDMFSGKDREDSWDAETAATITLNGTTAEAKGDGVTVAGTTITISAAGTYVVTGELEDGQIIVEAPEEDKVRIVLKGVTLTNDDSACILVRSADKVILTLAEGTENILSDTGEDFVQTDEGSTVDAVIFSREDLSLNGSGSLTVRANTAHGIVSKDDLVITGGTYTIEAAGKGLVGEDSVRIADGELSVTAADDAIHSSTTDKAGKGYIYIEGGTLTLQSGDDGIHAATSLIIAGGTITVTDSYEGLEGATVDILDGEITIHAQDDGVNAAYSLTGIEEASGENFGFGEEDGLAGPVGGMWDKPDITPENDGMMWEKDGELQDIPSEKWEEMGETGQTPQHGFGAPDGMMGGPGGRGGYGLGGMMDGSGGMPEDFGGRGGMMDAQEDAYLRISGGTIYVDAGGDGLDANGYLYMEGGTVQVDGPTNSGNGALDYGIEASISGGSLLAAGSAGMAESFGGNSRQYSLSYTFSSPVSGGTAVTLKDAEGQVVYTAVPSKDYQNVVISTEELKAGTYTITAGTQEDTVTITDIATRAGAAAGMGSGGRPDGSFGEMPQAQS